MRQDALPRAAEPGSGDAAGTRAPGFAAWIAAALVLLALGLAPMAARAADPIFPRGSAVGIVPPEGMTESGTFSGFEDRETGASLLMADMPPEAYAQIELGFTDAALASKGIAVESRGPFPIAGGKGLLVIGTQAAGHVKVRKWVLLAGNDYATALLTLQVPEEKAAAFSDAAVRAALATLAFRPLDEMVAALPFTLSNLAGFKVMRTLGGISALLVDAEAPEDAKDKAFALVAMGAGAPRDEERRQFALRALSVIAGVKELRIERAEPLRITGLPGYEVMATAIDARTDTPVKVVQWLRFGGGAHLRIVGVAPAEDFPKLYTRLRALRDGVEPR